MIKIEPITREEQFYNAILDDGDAPIPITREEKYLAKIAGEDVDVPDPITRKERFLNEIVEHGGGITPTGTINIVENGTVDVTEYAKAKVNVQPTLEEKTLTLGASSPSAVLPDSGYDGLSSVPITIDNTVIKAENIAEGATILGIAGTHSGGGGQIPEHGVFFIDYDGSIVTAWASDEVESKTALPDNPTHDGLVAQGWNWSLANIKSHIENYQNADVFVGQMYETASGFTEMDITVTKVTGLTVTCNMVGNKNWGDGTEDALTEHTYSDYGDYTITCDGTSIPSGTDSSGGLFGSSSSNKNRFWCTAVRIGDSVTSISAYALNNCRSLMSITIPDSVTSIGGSTFNNCYSLTSVTIPDGVTSIGSVAFNNCYSLTSVTIPDGVTSISNSVFTNCHSLTSVAIPDGVTRVGTSAFSGCHSMTSYDFTSAESIPTLPGTDTFTNINGICKIIVPDSLYNDWITATNWNTYANYIYKASEA